MILLFGMLLGIGSVQEKWLKFQTICFQKLSKESVWSFFQLLKINLEK